MKALMSLLILSLCLSGCYTLHQSTYPIYSTYEVSITTPGKPDWSYDLPVTEWVENPSQWDHKDGTAMANIGDLSFMGCSLLGMTMSMANLNGQESPGEKRDFPIIFGSAFVLSGADLLFGLLHK